MIIYYKNNEIDREHWDNCISNSPGAKPYAYSWFLDIMSPGWEALVDDDYDSVFPIPSRRKFGIHYVATPIFLQQLGAFSPDKSSDDTANEFLDYIPRFYKLIDLCIGQKPVNKGFQVTEKMNFELDVSKPYEKLWDSFSPQCRRHIIKSAGKKTKLVNDISPSELIDVFKINKGSKIENIKERDYQRLDKLMNYCIENNKGRIIGVRSSDKKIIFGIFLAETSGYKSLLFTVNTAESRERKINYYAINELIREYSGTKTVLDFAGSSIPSIASFMQSFGGVKVSYYRIYLNRLLWPIKFIR